MSALPINSNNNEILGQERKTTINRKTQFSLNSTFRNNLQRNNSDNNLQSSGDSYHIEKLWRIHSTIDILRDTMDKGDYPQQDRYFCDDLNNRFNACKGQKSLPPTYLVLALAPDLNSAVQRWLIEKLRSQKRDGGAELIVLQQPWVTDRKQQGPFLHVSASKIKLLVAAEEMELMKVDRSGQLREFVVGQLDDFLGDEAHIDDLLTPTECYNIVLRELEMARAVPEDCGQIAGLDLYEGQSILQALIRAGIVLQMYPLHDNDQLKKLAYNWYWSLRNRQPFEEIREYFGEAIALYFNFLGYYTNVLIVPMILGLVQQMVLNTTDTMIFFCVFNIIWVTIVLEMWKRKSNALAFKWGTIGITSLDEPRANFRGKMGPDPVSGKIQPQYARVNTYIRMYCVSLPIVVLCMVLAFGGMLGSFLLDDYLKIEKYPFSEYNPMSGVVYTLIVLVASGYYRKLATFLTEWENHRTQAQFELHRVVKLVLFEFVNNFMSLFYIGFVLMDMDMLRAQLQTMLIISQLVNNIQEAIWPLFYRGCMVKLGGLLKRKRAPPSYDHVKIVPEDDSGAPILPSDDVRIAQTLTEAKMDQYHSTFDDYLELFTQFGYVFLFSSVYPMAACWAFLNNVLEVRGDAFKLCALMQRPIGRRVKNIGAWQRAFEALGALSIITNCALLALSPQLRQQYASLTSSALWVLLFVGLEHILLGLRYFIHIAIADRPEWIRIALAKSAHESRQALKFERSKRNQKLLTRKCQTIRGH